MRAGERARFSLDESRVTRRRMLTRASSRRAPALAGRDSSAPSSVARGSVTRGSVARVAAAVVAVTLALEPAVAHADENYSAMSTEDLRDARHDKNIAGPIALLSVGGFIFLVGTPILLAGAFGSAACQNVDCSGVEGVVIVGAATTLTGAGMAVGGGVWLGSRLGERREIDAELKRREQNDFTFEYGVVPTPGGAGLGFSGTF